MSDEYFTGVDFLEKKFSDGKVDPVKERETNEKVTDKGREFLEKKGIHIPKAVSFDLHCSVGLLANVKRNANTCTGGTVQQLECSNGEGGIQREIGLGLMQEET
jgi:hypothetical protein